MGKYALVAMFGKNPELIPLIVKSLQERVR